jgi:hypothetical protein
MKSFIFFALIITATCAYAQQPVQVQMQTAFQYGMPYARLSVQNAAPWRCKIITVGPGKHGSIQAPVVAILDPGETAYAGRDKASLNPFAKPGIGNYNLSAPLNIPIVALYVDDNDRYIGAATGTFYIPGGGMTTISNMVIKTQSIRFADDMPPEAQNVPPQMKEESINLPYFIADGTSTVVVVWSSSTPARITMNGTQGDTLHLGDVKSYVSQAPFNLSISAVDGNGQMRTWVQAFPNAYYYGTWAQVFILGMNDLQ